MAVTAADGRCVQCGAATRVGAFWVLEVLARGSHGRVYLAVEPNGARVALKELVFVQVPDVKQLDAFEREGKILGALDHPRIPQLRACFREGRGPNTRLYTAHEFIEGASLAKHLERASFT